MQSYFDIITAQNADNYLGQSVRVEGDEHVEGMLEDVIGQVVELVGTEPLQLRAQGSELLIELGLFLSTNIIR